jgi:hypothetical protein
MANKKFDVREFIREHSLTIASSSVLSLWFTLYCFSNPSTHIGSFFGNAIADWSGVVLMVLATKYLYEKNSRESRRPPKAILPSGTLEFLRDHSLSIFLLITGIGWVVLFVKMDANSRWGQVVGNLVSEWTQAFGLVLLTKRLIERRSKQ